VLELLSHVNKRVQGQKSLKLPLAQLLDLFTDPKAAAITHNFALVYVEMAFKRASPEERFALVSPPSQSEQKSQQLALMTGFHNRPRL
jgi:proteasome component ECM29